MVAKFPDLTSNDDKFEFFKDCFLKQNRMRNHLLKLLDFTKDQRLLTGEI